MSFNQIMLELKEYNIVSIKNQIHKATLSKMQKKILSTLGVPGF
jgi:hypothetical protein